MFPPILLLLLVAAAGASEVLYTFSNLSATYYYDYERWSHIQCAKHSGGPRWSDETCAASTACGPSIDQMKTDNIVALNVTWMNERGLGHRAEQLCGREIQVFTDGRRIATRGPLFLWEACQACSTSPRVDLSVSAYAQLTGDDECWQGHVPGFEVRIMDNFIHRAAAGRATAGLGGLAAVALSCIYTLVM